MLNFSTLLSCILAAASSGSMTLNSVVAEQQRLLQKALHQDARAHQLLASIEQIHILRVGQLPLLQGPLHDRHEAAKRRAA